MHTIISDCPKPVLFGENCAYCMQDYSLNGMRTRIKITPKKYGKELPTTVT